MGYREIAEQRAKILIACDDLKYRAAVMEKCKRDIIYWFENFAYTDKNPAFFGPEVPGEVPFVLFDFQIEFVLDLWDAICEGQKRIGERNDTLDTFVEKSRQMGLSWLICGVYLYGFIFHSHKYLMISQKDELVDKKGDMRSLFEKLRFMLRRLPSWMLPPGLSKESETPYNKQKLIGRSDTTGSITGEAANPDAGTGGTYASILMDEMSKMPNASQINTSCARATPCRIFNSTPKGKGNEYYRMRKALEDAKKNGLPLPYRWHRLHWSEHPYYTQEWYENECRKEPDKTKIAQELDINYNSSVVGRVYPELEDKFFEVIYNEQLPLYISIDNSHGGADPHAIIVCQPDGHYWNIIDYLEINCSVTDIAKILGKKPQMTMNDSTLAFYNRYLKYKPAIFIADPYDTHSTLNTSTIYEEYRKVGLFLNTNIIKDKKEQIMKTRANIYRYKFSETCADLLNVVSNARYPEVAENSNRITSPDMPVHDFTSHGRSALEYLTCFLLENDKTVERPKIKQEIADPITGQLRTVMI